MSGASSSQPGEAVAGAGLPATGDGPARTLALACALALVGAFVATLYGVTAVVGGTPWLAAGVGGALLLATVAGRHLPVRAGLGLGAGLLVVGLAGYLLLIPEVYFALFTLDRLVADLLAMVAGRSVVLFLRADLWAVAVAPAPAFLAWYLALRRRYAAASLVGTASLGFFVLTGDAESAVTLAGMAAGLALLGLGSLERTGASWRQVADLGVAVGLAVVLARLVSVVPEDASALQLGAGPGGPPVEGELVDAGEQLSIQGGVSLSDTRRFTIEADRSALWRAGAYDRYTGGGWARAGDGRSYTGPLSGPPGGGDLLRQRVRVEAPVSTMPAAWKPVLLERSNGGLGRVSSLGGLQPHGPFEAGDEYRVLSQVPSWTEAGLRRAGTDYPERVRERYLDLPSTLPDRFHETAAEITADADAPYDQARAIQAWLTENKGYSLNVQRPDWDIADAFVHEMDEGYCTYFATAMAALLRAVGVPARFTVGYLAGEEVADGEWAVRGNDSHAWVEVYFPTVGWVPFDPTPSTPRNEARQREGDRPADDGAAAAGGGGDGGAEPATTTADAEQLAEEPERSGENRTASRRLDRPEPPSPLDGGGNGSTDRTTVTGGDDDAGRITADENGSGNASEAGPEPPDLAGRERLSALVAVGGALLGAYRLGLLERAAREVWLRYLPASDSAGDDVRRAYDRLEYYLGTRYRERGADETPREYLEAMVERGADRRALRVGAIYQRCRYADRATRAGADEAIELVEDLVRGGE